MLSPDDRHVFAVIAERPMGARGSVIPSWVNETGYVEAIPGRTSVGDTQNRALMAVLDIKSGKTVWADGSFAPPVPATEKPAPPPAGTDEAARPGRKAEREMRWSMPDVSDDGRFAVAAARSADNKDRWFVVVDPNTGKTRVVDTLHDDAWIREAGAGFGAAGVEFLPDNRRIWFLSERDGWMHLYTLDVSDPSAHPRQLTTGKWEVTNADVSRDGRRFYLTTTEVHPGERHVYAMAVDGGARTRLTSMTGSNEGVVSPDDSTLALIYSYSTKPPEVFVMPNQPGAAAIQVTTSPTEAWRSFK